MTDSHIHRLIEASSLGTPDARALRDTVSDETARRIVERAEQFACEDAGMPDIVSALPRQVYHCPINGCGWEWDRVDPNRYLGLVRFTPGHGLDVRPAMLAAGKDDDDACRQHLAEHPIEDFLTTINDLRAQLAERDRQSGS